MLRRPFVLTGFLALAVFLIVTACTGTKHAQPPMGGMVMASPQARASAYATMLHPDGATPQPGAAAAALQGMAGAAMDTPLSAVLCPQTPAVTNAAIAAITNFKVTQDDHVARVTWDMYGVYDGFGELPANVGGYLITWGPSGGTQVCSLVSTPQFDAQPLLAATNYTIAIQGIDYTGATGPALSTFAKRTYAADGTLGALTAGQTTFATDATRETAMEASMTGFFYTDNNSETPEYIDPDKWNAAFSGCDNPNTTGAFTNAQDHFHTMVGSNIQGYPAGSLGYCDRGQTTLRAHAQPDFTAGLTAAHTASGTETLSNLTEPQPYRTFVMDVDGPVGQRDKTYWDLIERPDGQPTDITGDVNVGLPFDSNTPNDLRVEIAQDKISFYYASDNGLMTFVAGNPFGCDLSCAPGGNGVWFEPNVRHSVVIHIGQPSHGDIWVDGTKMVTTEALAVHFAHPSLVLDTFAYNSPKDGTTDSFNHWDNLGFDGPAQTSVTYNYTDGQITSEKFHRVAGTYSDTVKMPDALTAATKIRLLFNEQTFVNQSYAYCSTDKVSINGHDFALPVPTSATANPPAGQTAQDLVGTYNPFQRFVDNIPSADIVTGDNAVVFTLCDSGVLNVHIEVTYPIGSAPTLTPWWTSWGLGSTVNMPNPAQGCWTQFTGVNGDTRSPNNSQNSPINATGTIPLKWSVSCYVQGKTNGKTYGVDALTITVDGATVATLISSPHEPVVTGSGTYQLNTAQFTNGLHQVDLLSLDDNGNPAAPGYFEAFNYTGADAPYKLNFSNSVTPTPTSSATASPSPSPTPIVTPSPTASPTGTPTLAPTVAPTATATSAPTTIPTPQPTPNPADPCSLAAISGTVAGLTQSPVNAQGIERAGILAHLYWDCEAQHGGTLPPPTS